MRATIPQAVVLSVVLAVGLRMTAVGGGLRGDDYVQAAMLSHHFPAARDTLELFRFAGPDAAHNAPLVDFGYLPWWSSPQLSIAMFRPLSSLLTALDHSLFGARVWLHHAHTLLWLAAAVLAVGALLFRLLPAPAAALSLLVYALDEAHSIPSAWLANRCTLIAATFGALALLSHVRAREDRSRRARFLSITCFALSLAAGEYGVSMLAYPLVYELLRRDRVGQRVRALSPLLVLALSYLGLRAVSGHGVANSGFYVNPTTDPIGYAMLAPQRLAALVGDMLLGIPALHLHTGGPYRAWLWRLTQPNMELFAALSHPRALHVTVGALALIGYLGQLRRLRSELDLGLATLAYGGLLALLPVLSAIPEDRLTGTAAIGVSSALGSGIAGLASQVRTRAGSARARAMAGLAGLLAVHLLWAPARGFGRVRDFAAESRSQRAWSLAAELPTTTAATTRVYLLAAADFTTAANLPFLLAAHGRAMPQSYRRLSGSHLAQDLWRRDARTLDLYVLVDANTMAGSLYRAERDPIDVGHRQRLPGLSIEVMASHAGNPTHIRYRFDRPLEADGLWFVQATPSGLQRMPLPAIGERVRLAPASAAHWPLAHP